MNNQSIMTCVFVFALAVAIPAAAQDLAASPKPLSTGSEVALARHLTAEKPTLFLFLKPDSTIERGYAEALRKEVGDRAGIQLIYLKTGAEPAARQYQVKETPTALIYDRRGRLVVRSSHPGEIRDALGRAAGVPRIDWAADDDPRMAEVEKLLGRRPPGGILRTMSLRPQWLSYIHDLSRQAHFADAALDRRTKEMIATYVSGLNDCHY